MAAAYVPPIIERRFDFYETEWVIEKFCLGSCRDKWTFQSPEFIVRGFHTTQWLMILKCKVNEPLNYITLTLKRSDSDQGPDLVWVNWRMNISERDSVSKLRCFSKGAECNVDLETEESIIETLKPFENDMLTVRCTLLIYGEDADKGFNPCANAGLRDLSKQLLELFKTTENHDLELIIEGKIMPVHKVIVCSRIEKLNYLLERESRKAASGECDVLELSSLSCNGMEKVIAYAYSGDLKHVLSEPSLEIYDCACKFDISSIKSYYTPNKLICRTFVNSQELTFKWVIDLRMLMCNEPATSPMFSDEIFGTTWQLHITPRNESNTDFFALYAETLSEIRPMCICLEFALIDSKDCYFFTKRLRCSTEGLTMFGIDRFIRVNAAKSFSYENCLRIVARLRLSDGVTRSYVERQDISIQMRVPEERSYYQLSKNMETARQEGFFSDLQLRIDSVVHKIHKCIMAVRCREIYDVIRQRQLRDKSALPSIAPNILCMLLHYLYTGVVAETNYEADYVELYKAAVDFNLPILKKLCSDYLVLLVENNQIIRAKVLEFSEQNLDPALRQVLLRNISKQ